MILLFAIYAAVAAWGSIRLWLSDSSWAIPMFSPWQRIAYGALWPVIAAGNVYEFFFAEDDYQEL